MIKSIFYHIIIRRSMFCILIFYFYSILHILNLIFFVVIILYPFSTSLIRFKKIFSILSSLDLFLLYIHYYYYYIHLIQIHTSCFFV